MKTFFLLNLLLLFAIATSAQQFQFSTQDWNKIQVSGFYINMGKEGSNAPIIDNNWWWGFTSSSIGNVSKDVFHNAQIAISNSSNPVKMYVRATNHRGEGTWAKILHSKGNHAIDGKLTAKEIEIKINTGADFVFNSDYNLRPLSEVKDFVTENKHLPDIPSEKQMQAEGLNLNDMQIKLLQKIEELTLYAIEQQRQLEEQGMQIKALQQLLENKQP